MHERCAPNTAPSPMLASCVQNGRRLSTAALTPLILATWLATRDFGRRCELAARSSIQPCSAAPCTAAVPSWPATGSSSVAGVFPTSKRSRRRHRTRPRSACLQRLAHRSSKVAVPTGASLEMYLYPPWSGTIGMIDPRHDREQQPVPRRRRHATRCRDGAAGPRSPFASDPAADRPRCATGSVAQMLRDSDFIFLAADSILSSMPSQRYRFEIRPDAAGNLEDDHVRRAPHQTRDGVASIPTGAVRC